MGVKEARGQMIMKIAIIIVGEGNTGKSTLLKELVKNHSTNNDGKDVEKANKGTRRLFFNNDKSLTQGAYIIFSSLSEDDHFISNDEFVLQDFIDEDPKKPFNDIKVLVYPDHPGTDIYKRNKEFLKKRCFEIIEFKITKGGSGNKPWIFNEEKLNERDVDNRVQDIMREIQQWTKEKL